MAKCKVIAKKTGKKCTVHALHGEEFCIFHSNSEAAKKYRKAKRSKHRVSREELIRVLTQEFRNLDTEVKNPTERIRLKSKIGSMLMELLQEVENLKDLERQIKELKNNGKI